MTELNINSNDRTLICGQTGGGKTVFAKNLADQCDTVIIYDIGWEVFPGAEYKTAHSLEDLDLIDSRKWVLQPHKSESGNFDEFCEEIFENYENLTIYIEEVGDILDSRGGATPAFGTILRRGRKKGIGVIMVSQRPSGFRTKLPITQSQHLICFRMFEEDDVKYIRKCAGLSSEHETMIRDLEGFEFFYYNVVSHQAAVMPAINLK